MLASDSADTITEHQGCNSLTRTAKKCLWENCPILHIVDRIGIDSFVEGIKKIKKDSANLLTDGASMVLFIIEERPLDDDWDSSEESEKNGR